MTLAASIFILLCHASRALLARLRLASSWGLASRPGLFFEAVRLGAQQARRSRCRLLARHFQERNKRGVKVGRACPSKIGNKPIFAPRGV